MSWGYVPIREQGKKCEVCNGKAIIMVEHWGSSHNLCKEHCRGYTDKRKSISMMKKELEKRERGVKSRSRIKS